MKIIFDSEEQKESFKSLIDGCCPMRFGLKGKCFDSSDGWHISDEDCDECWKRCGLEVEVKNE